MCVIWPFWSAIKVDVSYYNRLFPVLVMKRFPYEDLSSNEKQLSRADRMRYLCMAVWTTCSLSSLMNLRAAGNTAREDTVASESGTTTVEELLLGR